MSEGQHTPSTTPSPISRWPFYSLRSRLLLFMLLVALLPLAFLSWFGMHLVEQHANDDISQHLLSDLSSVTLFHQNLKQQLASAVRTAANDNTVRTTARLTIYPQLTSHLQKLSVQQEVDFLIFIDPQGTIRAFSSDRITTDAVIRDHPLVQEGLQGITHSSTMLESAVPILYILERTGYQVDNSPNVVIEAVAPVYFKDRFLGVILGGRMITGNLPLLRKMASTAGVERIVFFVGNRVAAMYPLPPGQQHFQGFRMPRSAGDWPPGTIATFLFSQEQRNKQVGLYQIVAEPENDTPIALGCFRDLRYFIHLFSRLKLVVITFSLLAVLASILLATMLARSLAGPLHQIAKAMHVMEHEHRFVFLPETRNDEIGVLVRGFNRLAATIQERVRALQREVRTRKQAQRELRTESSRLETILQSIATGVIATDAEGRITMVNRACLELLEQEEESMQGRLVRDIMQLYELGSKGPTAARHPVDHVLESLNELSDTSYHYLYLDQEGKERIFALRCSLQRDSEGDVIGTVLAFRDVTLERRLEEEMVRSQKLESVGVLAGGLAHDFNNLLTIITGNLSLMQTDTSTREEKKRCLADAQAALERAKQLTQQLLTFSRGGAPVKKIISLDNLLEKEITFTLRGTGVKAEFHITPGLWPVNADEGQIAQVLGNLALNGVQAMEGKGVLSVYAENIHLDGERDLPLSPGPYVCVRIRDHGRGIAPEHLDRIFDPYFTTKDRGSGLGLAVSHSIVTKHGGHMTVESLPGQGATFSIYLPSVDKNIPETSQLANQENNTIGGKGNILIMDDETMIRKVLHSMLTTLGYQVTEASDGKEAIDLYEQARSKGVPFDLVIMDLTVPGGMGGIEALAELRLRDPSIVAVVSSGYSTHPVMAEPEKYGFQNIVAKPYRLEELSRIVHETLLSRS